MANPIDARIVRTTVFVVTVHVAARIILYVLAHAVGTGIGRAGVAVIAILWGVLARAVDVGVIRARIPIVAVARDRYVLADAVRTGVGCIRVAIVAVYIAA